MTRLVPNSGAQEEDVCPAKQLWTFTWKGSNLPALQVNLSPLLSWENEIITLFCVLPVADEHQCGWTKKLVSDVVSKTDAVLSQECVDDLKLREYPELRMDCDSRNYLLTVLWESLPPDAAQLTTDSPKAKHISSNKITNRMISAAVRVHLWMLPPLNSSPPPLLVKSVVSGEGVTEPPIHDDFDFFLRACIYYIVQIQTV